MKKAIFFIIVVTVIISCQKELNMEVKQTSMPYFPNNIGNHWHYKYSKFNNTLLGTIDVNITKETILPDGQIAKLWDFDYTNTFGNHYHDTNYVVSDEQLVKIYTKPCYNIYCPTPSLWEKQRYILPLQVGNIWIWAYGPYGLSDTTKVLSQSIITVPAGTFENTFELFKTRPGGLNTATANTIWFTPYVGVTKFIQFEYDLGPVLGTGIWELKSYTLH